MAGGWRGGEKYLNTKPILRADGVACCALSVWVRRGDCKEKRGL